MKLSKYINSILELEKSEPLSKNDSFLIDGFDRSILILDDIEDKSFIRDGKPCFHIIHGIPKARREASKLYIRSFQCLNNVCKQRKIGILRNLYVLYLLKKLGHNIRAGQKIDKYLESINSSKKLLPKYERMIRLFTGGHIKYAFLIGFALSGTKPSYKNKVISIGEDIGILRQIDDDIKDYEMNHHEPLGDLIKHKNRLPELLFYIYANQKMKKSLELFLMKPLENQENIRELIFNRKVKEQISNKIMTIKMGMEPKITLLPKEYRSYLFKLVNIFSKNLL